MRVWPRAFTCTNCCKGCVVTIALLICLGSLKALPLTLYVYNATALEARETPTSRWVPQRADSGHNVAESNRNLAESERNVAESDGDAAESDRHADEEKPRRETPCWGLFCWLARRGDGRLDAEGFGGDPGYIGWIGPPDFDAASDLDHDASRRGFTSDGKTEAANQAAFHRGSASNGRTVPSHYAASQTSGPRPIHVDREKVKGVTRVGDDPLRGTVQHTTVRHRARNESRGVSSGHPHAGTGGKMVVDSPGGQGISSGAEGSAGERRAGDPGGGQGTNSGAEGSPGEKMRFDSHAGQGINGGAEEMTVKSADGQEINGGAETRAVKHARGQRDGVAGERGKGREKKERYSGKDAARGDGKSDSGEINIDDKEEAKRRCAGTRGGWCEAFLLQTPIPTRAPPRGNRTCLNNCQGAGVCNHDTGLCDCIAGYAGEHCQIRQKRPCTNEWRKHGLEPTRNTDHNVPGWTASRCYGVCDEDVGACLCNGTYGRIPAPPGSAPTALPERVGRPLMLHCLPKHDERGKPIESGNTENEDIWGPEGWCMAEKPRIKCPCMIEGWIGDYCDIPVEQMCLNQCSGQGECRSGFCLCYPGYYGHDCARKTGDAPQYPDVRVKKPWLENILIPPPAAADPPVEDARLRPLIYVYDLPPEYNTRMLQYSFPLLTCAYRWFWEGNVSSWAENTYSIEILLHEMLLQSAHRTLDPEEADFFYVPVYTTCYGNPVHGWADHPWFYGPTELRVKSMAAMALEVKRWVETHLPYWGRRGGADHVWLFPHDEGPCWAPAEIWNTSIILSHWGRKDSNPVSQSAYFADNYSKEEKTPWSPKGWTNVIGGHPCYDPKKDLLIPAVKSPTAIGPTPLFGYPARNRTTLLFFRGDFRDKGMDAFDMRYSRGIRQKLRTLATALNWKEKHAILIGSRNELPGSYADYLTTSRFCLVAPGDGWSPRAEDAILHGCIPVVIMDNVDPVFNNVVDWDSFAIRIPERELLHVPTILRAVTDERVRAMQDTLRNVWTRFSYSSAPLFRQDVQVAFRQAATWRFNVSRDAGKIPVAHLSPAHYTESIFEDDAFATILGFLHSKMPPRARRRNEKVVPSASAKVEVRSTWSSV